jgi:hypothetical protein
MRALLASLLGVGIGLSGTAPASAAPPPSGYPTSEVLATAVNPELGDIELRRGFWDSETNLGFGVDKAWNKHNIWSIEAQRRVLMSKNHVKQGNGRYALTAYAGKYKCDKILCTLTDQRKVVGIYNPYSSPEYHGWPAGGVLGLQTMYCDQGGAIKCPNWVTYSILNPGVTNPFSIVTGDSDLPTDGATSVPSEKGLSAQQWSSQSSMLQSSDIESLREDLAAGTAEVGFSDHPLPETISMK